MAPLVHIPHSTSSSSCLLQNVGTSIYTEHASIGATSSLVTLRTMRSEANEWRVELRPPPDAIRKAGDGESVIPLGHQDSPTGPCPITADDVLQQEETAPMILPSTRLATVAVVYDPEQHSVLLTRRLPHMRTFPKAWVLPGGGVDAEDASLEEACLRELKEETGLSLSTCSQLAPEPLCLWESCFPTTFNLWKEHRQAEKRCAHYLIVYMLVHVSSKEKVVLQADECDAAIWLPLEHLQSSSSRESGESELTEFGRAPGTGTTDPILASQIDGVYPNSIGEGIGRGHLFALEHLVKKQMEE